MPPPIPKLPPSPGGTSTGNAADSVEGTADLKPKIDFVDATIYCGIALTCDLIGWIPGAAYVTSPASMGGFKLFFWLKDINPPGGNTTLFTGMTFEMVPIVSEILPGCFGYVLLTCAGEMLKGRIAKVAGTVAGSPIAPPQARLIAAGVGAASSISQGQDPKAAISRQASNLAGGKIGGATASGVTASSSSVGAAGPGQESTGQTADESEGAGSDVSTSATFSAGSGGDFSGQVDFSSFGQAVGTREEGRTPSGLPQSGPAGAGGPGMPGIAADDGTGGRFAGGSPTSPGGAPTDPQAVARAKSMRAKMRGIKGGGARRIKPTRIYSMEDARKAKERRDEQERLAREKMAA